MTGERPSLWRLREVESRISAENRGSLLVIASDFREDFFARRDVFMQVGGLPFKFIKHSGAMCCGVVDCGVDAACKLGAHCA